MYAYINGVIKEITSTGIVVDVGGIGYFIYVASPYSFIIGNTYKVYLYQYVREDEISLYGFKTAEEKDLFLRLIAVKGLGCKMAMPMFATENTNDIINAIEAENITYLKKFPKIGDKVARQIILDLKGKLVALEGQASSSNEELKEALLALGYKNSDIQKVLTKVNSNNTIEVQIKEALKLLLK